jgi:hypothetical protein
VDAALHDRVRREVERLVVGELNGIGPMQPGAEVFHVRVVLVGRCRFRRIGKEQQGPFLPSGSKTIWPGWLNCITALVPVTFATIPRDSGSTTSLSSALVVETSTWTGPARSKEQNQ